MITYITLTYNYVYNNLNITLLYFNNVNDNIKHDYIIIITSTIR